MVGHLPDRKNWAHREVRPPKMPNEFGALKVRHQPLAEVSGMERKIVKGLDSPVGETNSCVRKWVASGFKGMEVTKR